MTTRNPTLFVGRQDELARIAERLMAAQYGDGGVLLVAGEPGIGKTRLAEETARLARERGFRTLWGRCYEDGGAPAYWPWIQALRAWLREVGPAIAAGDASIDALVLSHLLPELGEGDDRSAGDDVGPEAARFRLFDAVTALLRRLALAQPLLIVLDDLQWADPASLGMLQFLAPELAGVRLLLLCTYRTADGGAGPTIAQAGAVLARLPRTDRITLAGLSEAEVGSFISGAAGVAPADALVSTLTQGTGGNPFFITEVVQLLASEGRLAEAPRAGDLPLTVPRSVRDTLTSRMDRLSTPCRVLLEVAAVVGRELRLDTLERVTGLPSTALLAAVDEAVLARLLEALPGRVGRYRLVHDLVRNAIYQEIPPGRRAALHEQVGEALERAYRADPTPHLAELANHFVQAAPIGQVERAVRYATAAAEHARSVAAHADAAALFAMALEALSLREPVNERARCDLLLALGEARTNAGELTPAAEALNEAVAIARRRGWCEAVARAALIFGGGTVTIGAQEHQQANLLEQALACEIEDPATRVRLMARLALALTWLEQRPRALRLCDEALALARQIEAPGALAAALYSRRYLLAEPEHFAERCALSAEVTRLATEAGDRELTLHAWRWRVSDLLMQGDIPGVDTAIAVYTKLAQESHQPYYLWYATLFRAMRELIDGRYEEAEWLAGDALQLGQRANNPEAVVYYAYQLVVARIDQGRMGELTDAARAFTAQYHRIPGMRAMLAMCLAQAGLLDEARPLFDAVMAELTPDYGDLNFLATLMILTELCGALEDARAAGRLYDLLLPYNGQVVVVASAVISAGATARLLGRMAGTTGDYDRAVQHFEEAQALHARMASPPMLARTGLEMARVLLQRDAPPDRARAVQILEQADAQATALGMDAITAGIHALQLRYGLARVTTATPEEMAELRARLAEAEARANQDGLTGLANRAAWNASVEALTVALHRGEPAVVALIDVDHFKLVNDTYGHLAGDRALAALAELMQDSIPPPDACARIGGDEFAVLLRPATLAEARARIDALVDRIRRANSGDAPPGWTPITLSVGLASAEPGESAENVLERADRALYAVKQAGRNGVRVAEPATGPSNPSP